jgi:hypothetical protein
VFRIAKTNHNSPELEKHTPAMIYSQNGGVQPAMTPKRQIDTGTTTIEYTVVGYQYCDEQNSKSHTPIGYHISLRAILTRDLLTVAELRSSEPSDSSCDECWLRLLNPRFQEPSEADHPLNVNRLPSNLLES